MIVNKIKLVTRCGCSRILPEVYPDSPMASGMELIVALKNPIHLEATRWQDAAYGKRRFRYEGKNHFADPKLVLWEFMEVPEEDS